MKEKLGWIMFSVMTVVAIALSAVLISHDAIWKSGEKLLGVDAKDIKSAYVAISNTSTAEPSVSTFELSEEQVDQMVAEFQRTKFEKNKGYYDGGAVTVTLQLKDGSERSFTALGDHITIDGKQYKCHSYLTNYIYGLK